MMNDRIPFGKRALSAFLAVVMTVTMLPIMSFSTSAAVTSVSADSIVTDPGTAHTWESMMGTDADGNRYAGRVWVDKSVYKDGDTVLLNTNGAEGSFFTVDLADDEAFQVIYSALGSSMTTTTTVSGYGPMDVVLVIDNSSSMGRYVPNTNKQTRLEAVTVAAETLINDLLESGRNRIGLVTFSTGSKEMIPLDFYQTGSVDLTLSSYNKPSADGNGGVAVSDGQAKMTATATTADGRSVSVQNSGYQRGTNLQSGIDTGMDMLVNASDVSGRTPVVIVLADGVADTAVNLNWYDPSSANAVKSGDNALTAGVAASTVMNAAYLTAAVEDVYGKNPVIYGIAVDVADNDPAEVILDPGNTAGGMSTVAYFSENSSIEVGRTAYGYFKNWYDNGSYKTGTWNFNALPEQSSVSKDDVNNNIHYVDKYMDVSSAAISEIFEQIYNQLTSRVFNPISSSTTVDGATGVDNTPLVYVDKLGKYMELKDLQAVTLFGHSYNVEWSDTEGRYIVVDASDGGAGTGVNETTDEEWNTVEDILITVKEEAGEQTLEIRINQEILPILLDTVTDTTTGDNRSVTLTESSFDPIRFYYTVGIDSDILLGNGEIDITKIDPEDINSDGTLTLYSNSFGKINAADNGVVSLGDAHVGFKPSVDNRYYYHQTNQGIYTGVTNADGSAVVWEEGEYGVKYEENAFKFTYMTYGDYEILEDDDEVYTYVSFYRPTEITTDAENAAEKVTYIVYTDWGYLKESVAFYDKTAGVFINYDAADGYTTGDVGYAPSADQVAGMIAAYTADNTDAEILAFLAVGSLRTSRLHNMYSEKTENATATAELRFAPQYTYDTAAQHNDNDVVVWLGNNGRMTVVLETGIALTKQVTDSIGSAADTYALTVTVPSDVTAAPILEDADGNAIDANRWTYLNNVITVNLTAGETVYITGIPAGTVVTVGENIPDDAEYKIASKSGAVAVPTAAQVAAGTAAQYAAAFVENAPAYYGNLMITKEIVHSQYHAVPDSVLAQSFDITVYVGTDLAGETFDVEKTNMDPETSETQPVITDTVTVGADGYINLSILPRQTVEILRLPENTEATVTEKLNDAQTQNFTVSYTSQNGNSEQTDSDGKAVIGRNDVSVVDIINSYKPTSVTVDLDIKAQKNFSAEADALLPDTSFTVKVQENINGEWRDISGATATVEYSAGEYGEKAFSIIENVLNGKIYDEVGTWSYQVVEVAGDIENVTYDSSIYTFTVTVTDNDGQLVATLTDSHGNQITGAETSDGYTFSYGMTFVNTFHTVPVVIDIQKSVINKSGDADVSSAGFEFTIVQTDENWNALTGDQAWSANVFSDGEGEGRISIVYQKAGTYYYLLSENNDGKAGWSYSDTVYKVTVTVTENEGNLTAAMAIVADNTDANETIAFEDGSSDGATVSFVNTYDPADAYVELDVSKAVNGKTLAEIAGDFTFGVFADETDVKLTEGTNNEAGKVVFNIGYPANVPDGAGYSVTDDGVISFHKVGKYLFDVKEEGGSEAGWSYDDSVYTLVVEITNDTENGELVANWYYEDSVGQAITFTNEYKTTPTTYQIVGSKLLSGRAIRNGEFEFALYDSNNKLIETVKNVGNTFTFSPITYTEAGNYTYTVKEVIPEDGDKVPGVTYDADSVTVTVVVTDVNAQLEAAADGNVTVEFSNAYNAKPASVSFSGTKTLKGADLTDGAFTFELYATDADYGITELQPIDTAQNTDGEFSFDSLDLAETGYYHFVIAENAENPIDGVVYDSTVHRFRVFVQDIGDGQLRATVQYVNSGSVVSGPDAKVSATVGFTNATFDEVTEKTVYKQGDVTTMIDGKKVEKGDILTYNITYTNYTGQNVTATITDIVPKYTKYVEGTASHNGSVVDGYLLWILDVAAGDSVTVAFNVEVEETNIIVHNTATVRDGVNVYRTNEVTNYTVEDEVEKDVFSPADLTQSIDGDKVYEGDVLRYEITFTNLNREPADIEITDAIPENATYVDGSADNGGVYENGKLTWNIQDVPAWGTATVAFLVTVNSDIGAAEIENQAFVTNGTNNYETNIVSNYTVEDVVEKDVSVSDAPEISIDGGKVYAGDELIYTISYENTASVSATVTVTDTIPEHTTFAEAYNGGVYDNGVIIWTLTDVPAGETVTVSFKVRVNDVDSPVEIVNSAKIVEGENEYVTNETFNYTVEDEAVKDVFIADEPEISIDGEKVYAGDTLLYAVTYFNTAMSKATVTITDIIPANTTYVDGSADNGGVYKDGELTWILDVDPRTAVTVTFKVTVNDAGTAVIANKANVTEGKNSYTTNEVTNYTVEDEVQKDVFIPDSVGVSVDGETVEPGTVLMYAISYRNTWSEKVTVTITDTIPEHSTYVEGSADNGGVYADGKITWTVEVDAGETVTVYFKVEVNDVEDVTVSNKATVVEGENTYITNEVKNPVEVQDVPFSPQTGDSSNLRLWLALMLISGGAVMALAVSDRRKRIVR